MVQTFKLALSPGYNSYYRFARRSLRIPTEKVSGPSSLVETELHDQLANCDTARLY
jgi:hypothetical protein